MPTLREFMDLILVASTATGKPIPEDILAQVETHLRKNFPAERIYIMPLSSRKDPARGEAIANAARRLPTGIVSERMGISRQLVAYHVHKKSKNPDG